MVAFFSSSMLRGVTCSVQRKRGKYEAGKKTGKGK